MSSQRPHEPEIIQLLVSRKPGGGFVIRTPFTPGWAFPCATPADLARGVEAACNEYAVAAYARLRGILYDLAETEVEIPPEAYAQGSPHPVEEPDEVERARRRRRERHPATHEPEQWVELEDGRWLSPSGRRYGADTRVVRNVVASLGR